MALTHPDRPLPDRVTTLLHWVIFGVIFDLVVSIGLLIVALYSSHANDKAIEAASSATSAHIAIYQTCLANNQFRKDNLQLWTSVIHLIPDTTAANREFKASLGRLALQADSPRPCGKPPIGN